MSSEPRLFARLRVQLLAGDHLIAEIEDPSIWYQIVGAALKKDERVENMKEPTSEPSEPDIPSTKPVASPDTSTRDGRLLYDAAVIAAIGQSKLAGRTWLASEDLRPAVGGTPAQLGASLRRLCAKGQLRWTGIARGTKYTLALAPDTT